MIDLEKVLRYFALFADLERSQAEEYRTLCQAQRGYIQARLREEVDPSSQVDMERLATAAAARAYCDYEMLTGVAGQGGDEVKVGNITVKGAAPGHRDCLEIRDYFMAQVGDLLDLEYGPLLAVESL